MTRYLTPAVALLLPAAAAAQAPKYAWQKGQALIYSTTHKTAITETYPAEGQGAMQTTKLTVDLTAVKEWRVAEVAADGSATLQMSIRRMRMEQRVDDREPTVMDSSLQQAGAGGEQAQQYIDKPLTTIRVGPDGDLLEVVESKFGPAELMAANPPFKFVLPKAPAEPGGQWKRDFTLKMAPPNGAGEEYAGEQAFTMKPAQGDVLAAEVVTKFTHGPAGAERVPLLPLETTGHVYFDAKAGKYAGARLAAKHELADHRGAGSKYAVEVSYEEALIR